MNENTRLAYLHAMGIRQWVPRTAPAESIDTEPVSASLNIAVEPQIQADDPPRKTARLETQPSSAQVTDLAHAVESTETPTEPCQSNQPQVWHDLEIRVASCHACQLADTRTNTVFGVGDQHADLMIVGEAPGAEEDRLGEPFVGRAGRLLDQMLLAIGYDREQVYIANILKCRPPSNRDPRPDEVDHCLDFLTQQLALIRPHVILAVGRIAAQNLLQTTTPVNRLRGKWFSYGKQNIPLRVTYHPAYLLRSTDQKAKAWQDLCVTWQHLQQILKATNRQA